jgi:hypothetical protein
LAGKLVIESTLETGALTILQFVQGLRGNLQVTFEEGTWAAWLYEDYPLPMLEGDLKAFAFCEV